MRSFWPQRAAIGLAGLGLLAVMSLLGCTAREPTAGESALTAAPTLSDGELMGLVSAFNNNRVQDARLALSHGSDPVRQFAQALAEHHDQLNRRLAAAADQARPVPATGVNVLRRQGQGDAARDSLATLTGPAFDRAWLRHQVLEHRDLLNQLAGDDLDRRPLELRGLLLNLRENARLHLRQAQSLLAAAGG